MKKKKLVFLIFGLFLFMNCPKVYAAECVDFEVGDGTENNPYQIRTNKELYSVSCHMNSYFILMNDLDLEDDTKNENGEFYNNGKGWMALGGSSIEFTGDFNGNDKKIVGIYQNINNENFSTTNSTGIGLFTSLNGKVYDLILENYNIDYFNKNDVVNNSYNNFYLGTLSTYAHDSIINNISVSGKIEITNTNNTTNNLYIGGLLGRVVDSNLNGITNNVEIKTGSKLLHLSGGIVSEFQNSYLRNSVNNGNVEGSSAGGICAYSIGSTLDNVKNYGTVKAQSVGGIAFQTSGIISNSVNYGTIEMHSSGKNFVSVAGGLTGWLNINSQDINTSYIINSYNAGTINATLKSKDGDIGGLVGSAGGNMDDGTKPVYIDNSFNIGEINVTNATNYSCIGGLIGRSNANIENSYNAGNINLINSNNAHHVSELVGAIVRMSSDNSAGSLENVYYIEKGLIPFSNDGGSQSLNYTSLTFNQAILKETYKNFDFENIWMINDNYPFPQLKNNHVSGDYISSILINNNDYNLMSESEYQINYSIFPTAFTEQDIEFSIMDGKDIATINSTGKLNLTGEGKLVVRVSSKKMKSIYGEKVFLLKLRRDINTLNYNTIDSFVYNESAQTPDIVIKDGDYTLIKNTDYTVSYDKNTNVGVADVNIEGIGNYKGIKTLNFNITKANINVTDNSKDVTFTYDGESHSVDVKLTHRENAIVKYMDSNNEYTLNEVPKYTEVGTYITKYKVYIDNNYTEYFGQKTLKIEDAITYMINNYEVDETNKYINKIMVNTDINTYKSNFTLGNGYGIEVDSKEVNGKKVLYTGGETRITKGANLYTKFTNVVVGDINGDGAINSADLLKIRQHLLRTNILSGVYFLSSDINYDNTINSADLLRVRQHLLGTKTIE